jgi:hypothetical protein
MSDPPGITYVPSRKEFVVAWQGYEASGAPGISVQRVSTTGQLLGGTVLAAYDGSWCDEPSIAYDPVSDRFAVAYTYAAADAQARVMILDANAQPIIGPQIIAHASGTYLTKVQYIADAGRYFMVWADSAYRSVFLDANGAAATAPITIAPGMDGYDGFTFDYNPVSKTILFGVQGNVDASNKAQEMRLDGTLGPLTTVIDPIGTGNFGPRVIASHAQPRWLFMTSDEYKTTLVRLVGTGL